MSAKMNPDAPHFAPSDLAMVKHDGAVQAAESEDRPNDLIFHEALKHLIHEIREMKTRAASLEQENINLKQENGEVKQQIKSLRQVFIDGSAQAAKGNPIGYAVSETSSMGKLMVPEASLCHSITDISCRSQPRLQ
jgi:hypothetical protein